MSDKSFSERGRESMSFTPIVLSTLFSFFPITQTATLTSPTCRESGVAFVKPILMDSPTFLPISLEKLGHDRAGYHCLRCGNFEYDETTEVLFSERIAVENHIPMYGDVIIPEKVLDNGVEKTVVGIATGCFYQNKTLTSIVLPDTVRTIEQFAFNECTNLQSVRFPAQLEHIGQAGFQLCSKLEHVELPDSVRWLENHAFNHCTVFTPTAQFHIPASLERVGRYEHAPAHSFYNCGTERLTEYTGDAVNYEVIDDILYTKGGHTLVSIPPQKKFPEDTYVMPDSVCALGELSFHRNPNMKKVVISDNLYVDGEETFEQWLGLENHSNDLAVAVYGYTPVKEYVAKPTHPDHCSEGGVLYNKDKTHVMAIPTDYTGVLTIADGVTHWDKEAMWLSMLEYFKDLTLNKVTEVSLPSSLTVIDKDQLEGLNQMARMYGTRLTIRGENSSYVIQDNQLQTRN